MNASNTTSQACPLSAHSVGDAEEQHQPAATAGSDLPLPPTARQRSQSPLMTSVVPVFFNRRLFLKGTAAHALGASALASEDPAFAAVDDHANAYAALDAALARQEGLERAWLARSTDRDDCELTSNPRWVVLQLELDVLDVVERLAATALIRTELSGAAGAVALTRHVVSFRDRGYQWPGDVMRRVRVE